jgi:hypothetical protein
LQCRSQTRHRQCTPTVDNVADIERSISSLARQDNGGLVLPPDIFTNVYRKLIIGLAAEHRLLDARIATSKIHASQQLRNLQLPESRELSLRRTVLILS